LSVSTAEENEQRFERPVSKGAEPAAFQARVVGLVECATHAVFDATVST
jgi:hypothetical protein